MHLFFAATMASLNNHLSICSTLLIMATFLFGTGYTQYKYNMNETCKYYEGFVANPNDCQNYGYCSNGILLGARNCENGLYFDRGSASCVPKEQANCLNATPSELCAASTAAFFVPSSQNCEEYYYCNGGKSQGSTSCPAGQVFDREGIQCQYTDNKYCPLQSICGLIPDYKFAADPETCGNYILCIGGVEPYGSNDCGTSSTGVNMIYDPVLNECRVDANFCTGASEIDQSGANMCQDDDSPTFVAHPDSCASYFQCDGTSTTGKYGICPNGTHFDATGSTKAGPACVSPLQVECTNDRCENVNLQFMTAGGTSCGKYLVCNNGRAIMDPKNPDEMYTDDCPKINGEPSYFDEVNQVCVPKIPQLEFKNSDGNTAEMPYPICSS